ncbi:hypothetical protein [Rhodohalobacter sulfatireducens]|nr:hypothetical protein [Rhodohalobacter sulfatireducens]
MNVNSVSLLLFVGQKTKRAADGEVRPLEALDIIHGLLPES